MEAISLARAAGSLEFAREIDPDGGTCKVGFAAASVCDTPGEGGRDETGAFPPGASSGAGDEDEAAGLDAGAAARPAPRPPLPFSSKTLSRSSMSCSNLPFDGTTTYCEREGSSSAFQAVIFALTATSV